MNSPYKVRIKPKVKIRFAFILIVLGITLFFVFRIDSGYKPDSVTYGKYYLLESMEHRLNGHRGQTPYTIGRFTLPSGKVVKARIPIISHNGLYCVAEILVNDKVNSYQVVKYSNCI